MKFEIDKFRIMLNNSLSDIFKFLPTKDGVSYHLI